MTPRTTAATAKAPIWSKLCMSVYSAARPSRTRRSTIWNVTAYIHEYTTMVTKPTSTVKRKPAPNPNPVKLREKAPRPWTPPNARPTTARTTPTMTAATRAVTASGPQSSLNNPHACVKHLPMSIP